jgi:hypothetical protein
MMGRWALTISACKLKHCMALEAQIRRNTLPGDPYYWKEREIESKIMIGWTLLVVLEALLLEE